MHPENTKAYFPGKLKFCHSTSTGILHERYTGGTEQKYRKSGLKLLNLSKVRENMHLKILYNVALLITVSMRLTGTLVLTKYKIHISIHN